MSEFLEGTFSDYLKRWDRDKYLNDAPFHAGIQMIKMTLAKTEKAMQEEGITDEVIQRIINNVLYGHPDGAQVKAFLQSPDQPGTCTMTVHNVNHEAFEQLFEK